MSEEEQKAIEWLKKATFFSGRMYAPTIINLIYKQQKEIEELKKCYVIEPKELEKEIDKEWRDKIREILNKDAGQYMKFYRDIEQLLEE